MSADRRTGVVVEQELAKLIGQQVPIKTRTGGRMMDFIFEVHPVVVVLTTNADGTGRRTLLSVDCIESVTFGGPGAATAAAATGAAAVAAPRPNWMPEQ